jgi:hypothetical protein
MPVETKLDADGALKQFDALLKNLADLETETSTTLFNWQAEDMHRHFPKVDGSGLSVSTTIYPRSRLPRKKLAGGKSTRRRARIAAGRPTSHRPILRPELFEKLKERMMNMLKEAATWQ